MVPGVEVWVLAQQQQLGISTDIPATAVSICCGGDWLALNCSDPVTATAAARRVPATAAAAARRMPALLQPGVASKLLLTATARQHALAVCLMVHLAVMQQQIDAAALEAMLLQLLWQHDGAQELLPLPAADQLSTDAVVRLLRAVIQAPDAFAVLSLLRRLPATRQLSTGHVESLLQACMQEVAAHQSSSSSSSSRRGCAPQKYSPYRVFESLIQMPAARQLNSSAALQLNSSAALQLNSSAALQLNSSAALQLLHTAIATDGCDFLGALCALPAAASISSEGVASLLQAAFSQRSAAGSILAGCAAQQAINAVVHLPAFDQISCASAAQLMLAAATAAQHSGDAAHCHEHLRAVYGAFVFLCELPAARQLSSEQLLQPFQIVVQQHSGEWTERICRLPAAQQLSSAAVEQLLLAAAAARTPDVLSIIRKLLGLPAAQHLSSAAIERCCWQLLQCAPQTCVRL
uniref:Uncharacterized protein n=1 Tax=Tetradesmus obliquus TaxID=3088 RepID=A0A383V5Y1_TETOB|eukprot:jgi/Sobl393_1/13624/SZX60340.1